MWTFAGDRRKLANAASAIRDSLEASCHRLEARRVALLQLHNSITRKRDDLPTSLSFDDVLGAKGVAGEFESLRTEGLVENFWFTGLGDMHIGSRGP